MTPAYSKPSWCKDVGTGSASSLAVEPVPGAFASVGRTGGAELGVDAGVDGVVGVEGIAAELEAGADPSVELGALETLPGLEDDAEDPEGETVSELHPAKSEAPTSVIASIFVVRERPQNLGEVIV